MTTSVKVLKKDGTQEPFQDEKIIKAVTKSAYRAIIPLTDNDKDKILDYVHDYLSLYDKDTISVPQMHNLVESALEEINPKIAKSYRDYRNYKTDFVEMLDGIFRKSQSIMYIGDKDNANTDSALVSTKRSLIFNQLNKELYQKFFMTTEELQACKDGYIYVHDMSARRDTMNCCLSDVKEILSGGFEMGNIWYNEPNSLDTAFDVIGDIVLSAASQQYGGYTISRVDEILEPYAEKSYKKYTEKEMKKYKEFTGKDPDDIGLRQIDHIVDEQIHRDMEQGFQGWEYKFNTVASSRGDYPFVTITIGAGTGKYARMAAIECLKVRNGGQGAPCKKRAVLFPKVVFTYTKDLHGPGMVNEDVFEEGIKCSAHTMYPDWLSLDGDTTVSKMWHQYGEIISPMGCVIGSEVVTYKLHGNLYVESIERMWDRVHTTTRSFYQKKGEPHQFMDPSDVEIYDSYSNGFVTLKRMVRNVSTDWVRVKMSNGRTLLCTPDHPLPVIEKGRTYARDLELGDKIPVVKSQYVEETEHLDKDYSWALGVFLCDGSYDKHATVSIAAEGEDEIQERLGNILEEEFDTEMCVKIHKRGKKGNYKDLRFHAYSKLARRFFREFEGKQKIERKIPTIIFKSDRETRLSFLAGMIDADGYINESGHGSIIQIGSTNKELATEQMLLMQSIGFRAFVYENHYDKKHHEKIRYRVECEATSEIIDYIACEKKRNNFRVSERANISSCDLDEAVVTDIKFISMADFSYDVTTESDHFDVSGINSHNCRAFLSPYYEHGGFEPADENDKPVFTGRWNGGVVSLHLPMILAKSRKENKDFYEVLDYYLELIRGLHIRTKSYLGELRASVNPLEYCYGGFYRGHLGLHDKIAPLLDYVTFSYGITALNELNRLYNGKSIREDGEFPLEVMEYINTKLKKYKKEDHVLYAVYGTPAESLCGLQVKQFRKMYGIIEGVSDKEYVSNSFHCHVTEDMRPLEKQDKEYRFWNLLEGGRIQYVKYPVGYNLDAIKTLVTRAMEMGLYEGINLSMAYCEDCGYEELNMGDKCPKCGSTNLIKVERMNGYLSYSRVHGDTRLNDSKMAEIADRKSM